MNMDNLRTADESPNVDEAQNIKAGAFQTTAMQSIKERVGILTEAKLNDNGEPTACDNLKQFADTGGSRASGLADNKENQPASLNMNAKSDATANHHPNDKDMGGKKVGASVRRKLLLSNCATTSTAEAGQKACNVSGVARVAVSSPTASDAGSAGKQYNKRTPPVYYYKNIYEQKKDQLLRARAEQERKEREFRSRPMPNFMALHQRDSDRTVVHMITVPQTPCVLKRSRESELRRQEQLAQFKQTRETKKQNNVSETVKPFNLRCERRVQERRLYDAARERAEELKRKQDELAEEERKKSEEEEIKAIRRRAVFKARPNPFK